MLKLMKDYNITETSQLAVETGGKQTITLGLPVQSPKRTRTRNFERWNLFIYKMYTFFVWHRNTLVHSNIIKITFRCIGLVDIIGVCSWGGVVLPSNVNTISPGLLDLTRSPELKGLRPDFSNVVLVFTNTNVLIFDVVNTFPAPGFGLSGLNTKKSYWHCSGELPLPKSKPQWYSPVLYNRKLC